MCVCVGVRGSRGAITRNGFTRLKRSSKRQSKVRIEDWRGGGAVSLPGFDLLIGLLVWKDDPSRELMH